MKVTPQRGFILALTTVTGAILCYHIYIQRATFSHLSERLHEYRLASIVITPAPTLTLKPTLTLSPHEDKKIKSTKKTLLLKPTDSEPWGVAQKVDDVTYTIKVGADESMATPQEVLQALNNYRTVNGKSSLTWDDKLASYAQSRANHFSSIAGTDKHAGFDTFLNNENGFASLGFRRVGENSYYGGKLNGVHMIEWVFAKSPGHNANQLDSQWTHVGIGVTDTSANLNFGGEQQ